MICKRCGSALPSEGAVCKQCGAMMTKEQIEEQKKWKEINKQNNNMAKLLSDKYNANKEAFRYDTEKTKDNKYLGLIIVLVIFLVIVGVAVAKFLS